MTGTKKGASPLENNPSAASPGKPGVQVTRNTAEVPSDGHKAPVAPSQVPVNCFSEKIGGTQSHPTGRSAGASKGGRSGQRRSAAWRFCSKCGQLVRADIAVYYQDGIYHHAGVICNQCGNIIREEKP